MANLLRILFVLSILIGPFSTSAQDSLILASEAKLWPPEEDFVQLHLQCVKEAETPEFQEILPKIALDTQNHILVYVRRHHYHIYEGNYMELNLPPEGNFGIPMINVSVIPNFPETIGATWSKLPLHPEMRITNVYFKGGFFFIDYQTLSAHAQENIGVSGTLQWHPQKVNPPNLEFGGADGISEEYIFNLIQYIK